MSVGLLTELQVRVLRTLTTVTPAWTLTGGAALAGFYTAHRTTRDLDLFWQGLDALGSLPSKVEDTLRAAGFAVDVLQAAPASPTAETSTARSSTPHRSTEASRRSRSRGCWRPSPCPSSRRDRGAARTTSHHSKRSDATSSSGSVRPRPATPCSAPYRGGILIDP